jgi:hypothetical protein
LWITTVVQHQVVRRGVVADVARSGVVPRGHAVHRQLPGAAERSLHVVEVPEREGQRELGYEVACRGDALGHALYAPVFDDPTRTPPNLARFCFLDPRADDFYADWDEAANTTVALLRTEAGRAPYDRR